VSEVFLEQILNTVGIVGTGFVADLYMRSLKTFPEIKIVGAFDIDRTRLSAFCAYWDVPAADDLHALLSKNSDSPVLILNLTNPASHFDVSRACLEVGKHVYSEKPLATNMEDASALCELADRQRVMLASAPCSILGETAQTLWLALRTNVIGKARLVYAELDDDFVPQAAYRNWKSESGAPWPYRDEFGVGCTLEHAGYYLAWLIAMFGAVERVVAASANVIPDKLGDVTETAPDFSCATLFFESGVVARLTCSIVAPLDHSMRIFGDGGILEVDRSWDNDAPVRLRRRHVVRRRLINSPLPRRLKLAGATHPKVKRWGAAAMNFALGPAEMLSSLAEARHTRLTQRFALHLTEVTLAIQNACGAQLMRTRCEPIEPMPWANRLVKLWR
jgi:predicted dehydrogenase